MIQNKDIVYDWLLRQKPSEEILENLKNKIREVMPDHTVDDILNTIAYRTLRPEEK